MEPPEKRQVRPASKPVAKWIPPEARRVVPKRGPGGDDPKSRFITAWNRDKSRPVHIRPPWEQLKSEFVDDRRSGVRLWRVIYDDKYIERVKKQDAEALWFEYWLEPEKFEGSNEPAPYPPVELAASEEDTMAEIINMVPTLDNMSFPPPDQKLSAHPFRRIEQLEKRLVECTATISMLKQSNQELQEDLQVVRDTCVSLYERMNSMQRRIIGLISDVDVHGGWLHVLRDDMIKHSQGHTRATHLPRCLPGDRHLENPLLESAAYTAPQLSLSLDGDVEENPGPEALQHERPDEDQPFIYDWWLIRAAAGWFQNWRQSVRTLLYGDDTLTASTWERDLTAEGIEPNPGWAHGKYDRKGKGKETPPTSRSRESSAPGSPKDSLWPMRGKRAPAKKGGSRAGAKATAINKSLASAVQQLQGENDAIRATYRAGIPCRDYAAGRCSRGPSCAFSHEFGSTSSTSAPAAPKAVCRRFQRPSGCPFGAQCHFLHVGSATTTAAAPTPQTATATANQSIIPGGPISLGLPKSKPKVAPPRVQPVRMQAGGALTGTSASSTPSQPAAPLPAPNAAVAAILNVQPPRPPPLNDEMKERARRERNIRRRINRRTKLVFYERVGVSNPLTALVLAGLALLLIAASAITETLLAHFDVTHWSLSLLFTIPLVLVCISLLMVCIVYLTAGQKMIRHQYILYKDPNRWLPDEDLRTDLGATTRLDHDSQRLAQFVYTRSFCFTHDERSNRKNPVRYRCALAWENLVRAVCFLPRLEIVSKKGNYSEELLAQACNAHNMSVRSDLETVKDRVSQVVRTKASMPLNRFDQTNADYIVSNTEHLGVAVWMDQQRSLRHLPFVVPPSPTATFSQ